MCNACAGETTAVSGESYSPLSGQLVLGFRQELRVEWRKEPLQKMQGRLGNGTVAAGPLGHVRRIRLCVTVRIGRCNSVPDFPHDIMVKDAVAHIHNGL